MTPSGDTFAPLVEIGSSGALVVRLGEAEFGLPVDFVREVSRVPRITRIPFSPPAILGVIALRGAVLAVLDLGERLLGTPARRDGRIVVVEDPTLGGRLALLVDRVVDLVPRDLELADAPAEVAESLPEGWITGVLAPSEERLVALLELEAVLAADPDRSQGRGSARDVAIRDAGERSPGSAPTVARGRSSSGAADTRAPLERAGGPAEPQRRRRSDESERDSEYDSEDDSETEKTR